MPAIDQLARALGLKLDGFELEAQDLWNKLETLASDNPLQYQHFISQTIIDTKSNTPENKSFRPHIGFCIKTICLEGHGKKVIDCTNDIGLPCYVNFCHHSAVDPVTNGNSMAHQNDFHSGVDIAIPLAVGTVREMKTTGESSKDIVIDVVFHSDVIRAAERESFKTDLIQLAMRAIYEDKGLKLDCHRVVQLPLSKGYMGGLGINGDSPVRFIVQTGSTQTHQLSVASLAKGISARSEVFPDIKLCPIESNSIFSTIKEANPKIILLPDISVSSNFHVNLQLNDYLTFKIKVYYY